MSSGSISAGMVAENSMFWRCLGRRARCACIVGQEAAVEHAIGLVEHQDLERVERHVVLLQQVHKPARCGDEYVTPLRSASACGLMLTPPKTTAWLRPSSRP